MGNGTHPCPLTSHVTSHHTACHKWLCITPVRRATPFAAASGGSKAVVLKAARAPPRANAQKHCPRATTPICTHTNVCSGLMPESCAGGLKAPAEEIACHRAAASQCTVPAASRWPSSAASWCSTPQASGCITHCAPTCESMTSSRNPAFSSHTSQSSGPTGSTMTDVAAGTCDNCLYFGTHSKIRTASAS